jgi:hypothetical protein
MHRARYALVVLKKTAVTLGDGILRYGPWGSLLKGELVYV